MIIQAPGIDAVWSALIYSLLTEGRRTAPRGQGTVELLNVQLQLTDPRCNVLTNTARRLNYRFMVAEWLWIWFGRDDVQTIARYNPNIAQFSDDGVTFNGGYGRRYKQQWDTVKDRLRAQRDTRQAVIRVFDERDLLVETRDVPCTLSQQFLVRDHRFLGYPELHSTVNMRSSDAWLGLPYDIFNFSMLQNIMAAQLDLNLGALTLNLGSSHLYDKDLTAASEVYAGKIDVIWSPMLHFEPPAWLEDVLTDPVGTEGLIAELPWTAYARALTEPKMADVLAAVRRAL